MFTVIVATYRDYPRTSSNYCHQSAILKTEIRLAPCKMLATQSPPSIKVYVFSGTYHGFDQDDITTVRTDVSWKSDAV